MLFFAHILYLAYILLENFVKLFHRTAKSYAIARFFHIDLNSNQKKFKGLVKAKSTHKKQQFNFGHVQFIQISYKNQNRFKNFRLLYE